LGYTLKKVQKTLPLKRIPETEAIFENVLYHRQKDADKESLRISVDVKDKVKVGKLSRKGYTRSIEATKAFDKDQQWETSLVPFGVLEFDSGHSTVIYGNSAETSDFLVDALERWYDLRKNAIAEYQTIEIFLDNGPQISSRRTQFIKRIMEFACRINKRIHLVYYPPYHSKYNPIVENPDSSGKGFGHHWKTIGVEPCLLL